MKYVFSFLMTMSSFVMAHAQQGVGIGTSTPNSTSLLDLVSTTKGILIPRMTTSQRLAIGMPGVPATGLLVYETTTNTVWLFNGTAWTQLGSGVATSQWFTNATHIYNGNAGNVGIGVNLPTSKFHLAGNMLMDGANPTLQLQNAGVDKGFVQLSGDNIRIGTNSANNSGRVVMRVNATDRVILDSTGNLRIEGSEDASLTKNGYLMLGSEAGTNIILDNNEMMARNAGGIADLIMQNDGGNVGIGTSPSDKLDVNGTIRLTGESRQIRFETGLAGGLVTKYAPGIHFLRSDNTRLGVLEYVDTVGTNFLRLRTGSTISNDFVLTTGHDICIGGSNPNAKLEVRGLSNSEVFRVHAAADPVMQFTIGNAGGGLGLPLERKGFFDVNGDDFRIGTNAENDAGNFLMRVNGSDVVKVTPTANVGIGLGTGNPAAKLHVAGKIFANTSGEAVRIDGSTPSIGFYHNGGATATSSSFITQNATELYIGVNGRLHLDATTSVSIGAVDADGDAYKLAVNGKVVCEELKVKLSGSWPDYVFNNDYNLLPLGEVRKFIDQHKHLPNIPAAAEIEKKGIEVGDMQKRMLEKIEELTLYVIDLQKQVDDLKSKARQPD
jgi:hypothetical protein